MVRPTPTLPLLAACLLAAAAAYAQSVGGGPSEQSLDLGGSWRFAPGDGPERADPGFDDSGWEEASVPGMWAGSAYGETGGYAWYRARVAVPEGMRGRDLTLYVETAGVTSFEVYAGGALV